MLANGKLHAGKQNTYTQLDIRTSLWRVFRLVGRCGVRDYRAHRLPGEISVHGILYRCGGRWNWLLASFGIPTQNVGRPIKKSRGVFRSRPLARRRIKVTQRDSSPIKKPTERICLKCPAVFVSVHFTCPRCRAINQQYADEFACL